MTDETGFVGGAAGEALSVGSVHCQVVPDGMATYERATIFANAPEQELTPLLEGELNEEGLLVVPYNPFLIQVHGELVLIDTGAGSELASQWEEPVGRMRQALEAARVSPKDVGVVVISHGHPDHIGGLTTPAAGRRKPIFARARHLISSTEWDFWLSEEARSRFGFMAEIAQVHLPPLREEGLLELVAGDTEVLPGVRLLPAPGHTPGHMVVAIESGNDSAVFVADALGHELNFEHPGWVSALEWAPAVAVETRLALLDRASRDGSQVIGFHLPHVGRVERSNGAFRFRRTA